MRSLRTAWDDRRNSPYHRKGMPKVYRAAAIAPRASYAAGSGILAVVSAPRVSRRNRVCSACRDRLEFTDEFVAAMRAAAAKIRESGTGEWGAVLGAAAWMNAPT